MLFHFCRHTYNKVANIIKIITKQKLLPISIFHNFNVCFQLHLELFASLDKVIYIVKKDVFSSLSENVISLLFLSILFVCKSCFCSTTAKDAKGIFCSTSKTQSTVKVVVALQPMELLFWLFCVQSSFFQVSPADV